MFAPGVASAQDATIAGTVTDATGGILPGVAVEAPASAGWRAIRRVQQPAARSRTFAGRRGS